MLEVQLDLGQPHARAVRVHRHADLHPEAGRERRDGGGCRGAQVALPRDRRLRLESREAPDRPGGEPERDPEPSADAPCEDGDDELALADEACQLPRRRSQVPVGEEKVGQRAVRPQTLARARFAAPPFPSRAGARTSSAPSCSAMCGVASVDASSATTMRASGNACFSARSVSPRRSASFRAVTITAGTAGTLPHASYEEVVSLPDVEAHITGTVWKVECQVGQEVEEGDTLVILESMKMEMPVEAEDEGTVKEIKCEEGQSVSEGDTLVVLE